MLPDLNSLNYESLKALILAQHATLTTQNNEIQIQRQQLASKDEQLASREAEIERLESLGVLNEKFLVVHSGWLEPEEVAILAKRKP